jgi:carboxyl-terminal processing protease
VVDVRSSATGPPETGLAAARVFVPEGTLGYEQERGKDKVAAGPTRAEATVTLPVLVLTDNGTSGAAELFAAALQGNRKAEIVGERTRGRAARQKLVKLPDGSGLLLTHLYYLAPGGGAINEKGIVPDVAVEQPTPEFGQTPPAGDPILEKALAHVAARPAA